VGLSRSAGSVADSDVAFEERRGREEREKGGRELIAMQVWKLGKQTGTVLLRLEEYHGTACSIIFSCSN
jgi:hypothetical protein